jgi:hypothetical protein
MFAVTNLLRPLSICGNIRRYTRHSNKENALERSPARRILGVLEAECPKGVPV